jgi:hypothetical protein
MKRTISPATISRIDGCRRAAGRQSDVEARLDALNESTTAYKALRGRHQDATAEAILQKADRAERRRRVSNATDEVEPVQLRL